VESIYAQLHYAGNGKRTFRVYCFEYSRGVLGIRKDARVSRQLTWLSSLFLSVFQRNSRGLNGVNDEFLPQTCIK